METNESREDLVQNLKRVILNLQNEREELLEQISDARSRLAAAEFDRDVLFDRLSNESVMMGDHNAV